VRSSYDASYQVALTSSSTLTAESDGSKASGSASNARSSSRKKHFGFQHVERPSLLATEASANSYRGLINLLVILLVRPQLMNNNNNNNSIN
jgi:hypothetical protein